MDMQSVGGKLPAQLWTRLRRRVFNFFNSGAGFKLLLPFAEASFARWKRKHPHGSFGTYYAESAARSLSHGGSHKTLGTRVFLGGSQRQKRDEFALRGVEIFEALRRHGFAASHRCVDYGCGSLRVGQHAIRLLDRGHYFGLDLVRDFYEMGLLLLPPKLVEDKLPRFGLIDAQGIAAARAFSPDFVISTSVMRHVPPAELKPYLEQIVSILPPGGEALITFVQARKSKRRGMANWAHDEHEIEACIKSVDPALNWRISRLSDLNRSDTALLQLRRSHAVHHQLDRT